jgi:hypothetical protein
MARNLTVTFTVSNGTRLRVDVERVNKRDSVITAEVTLRTGAAGTPQDAEISRAIINIRNGRSDLVRRAVVSAGGLLTSALAVDADALSTPTGFTDALAAYRQGDVQFENHVAGGVYADASLAST